MLEQRSIPTLGDRLLPDGTAVRDLVDLDERGVSLRVLTDPDLFELELEHLWSRAWTMVAHESEIPEPGDYVKRRVGADPVVVVRGDDGRVEILLNVCTHRGMQVCRADAGNATRFRCPYHGWVFGRDGALQGAPFEREMYGDALDKSALGLQKARVGAYAGMIFATWDDAAPSLVDYLGDFAWYLDTMFCRSDDGLEVTGPPQRFVVNANWKTACEQFAGDGYHGFTLHRSLMELGLRPGGNSRDAQQVGSIGIDVSTPHGHGLRCIERRILDALIAPDARSQMAPMELLTAAPPPGLPAELVPQLARNLSPEQLELLARTPPTVGSIFPNVGILGLHIGAPGGGSAPALGLHAFVPLGVDRFEFLHWNLVETSASEEYKQRANANATYALGSGGLWEQDDSEAWPAMQSSARGWQGRKQALRYQALLGVNRPEGWLGGGLVYSGFSKDDNQWNWWLRYFEYLAGAP